MQTKKKPNLWVSHSSIGDFLSCPRAYYIRHVYRDPKTGNKVALVNPALTLGQIVHQVLEALSVLPVEERLKNPLIDSYNKQWEVVGGKRGGFKDEVEELEYKNRGAIMINRVMFHPGPILQKAVKLVSPDSLPPRFFLSKEEDIILCGKIDWLEYIQPTDSIHIIDFKTGLTEEDKDSLQLPIYALLVKNCQNRNVSKISYWYLETQNAPTEMPLPNLDEAKEKILQIALKIKNARLSGAFVCPKNGCFACKPLENILEGKATFIGTSDYQDLYINEALANPNDYPKEDVIPF